MNELFNRLTGILLKSLTEADAEQNIVFSPYSIFTLLAIAADATAGKTRSEIMDFLLDGTDPDEAIKQLKDIYSELTEKESFSSANAVIVREDRKKSINPGYPEHLKEAFNGKLFSAENMVSAINDWVRRESHGMIRELADESMKDMLFCLLNACTFESRWSTEYDGKDIKSGNFHNRDGSVSRVKMLRSLEKTYIEDDRFIGFAKPYKGRDFKYVVLLPKDGVPLTGDILTDIDYSSCLWGAYNTKARVTMPEFQIASEYDLAGFCKDHGIRTVFSPQADFSPLSSDWLKAEKIRHKVYISVDREGTRAAAITDMEVFVGSAYMDKPRIKDVVVDRPFIFAVVHDSGLPVFVGTVNHLESRQKTEEDRMSKADKEKICKQIFDRICGVILDENRNLKDEDDYFLAMKVMEAYGDHDLQMLKSLEKRFCGTENE